MSIETVPAGTSVDVGVLNVNQDGDEILEVWLRPYVGAAGTSGVAQEVLPGVWVGAGDFSEFSLQGAGALPSGLTEYSGGTDNHEIIDSDTPTKRVWRRNENTHGKYAVAYDAFDDLFQMGGEMLIRAWTNAVTGSGWRVKFIGTVFFDDAGNQDDGLGVQLGAFNNQLRWSGGEQVGGGVFAGLTTEINDGAPCGFNPCWVWMRIRLDDEGGGMVRFRCHATYSDYDAKPTVPGVWDVDEIVATSFLVEGMGSHLGFARSTIGPQQLSDRMWSFMGFTSDYLQADTPADVSDVGGIEPGAWYLAASVPVAALEDQVVAIDGLDVGTLHDCALRYRRGVEYNAGAADTGAPESWPSISRGQFTTTVDPPAFVSGVWTRESANDEQIELTVTPVVGEEAEDINVYRELVGEGAPTLIGTIAGPHGGNAVFVDDTIVGEKIYFYSFTTVTAGTEGAQGPQERIWSGPLEIPTYIFHQAEGGGYGVGFAVPADTAQGIELWDTYDNLGAETSFALRATVDPIGILTEMFSGNLVNVPAPDLDFSGRLRHKQTLFAVADYSEYSPDFTITVPESE